MNIFHLARCIKLSAQSHIDVHCNKMILESCQMLCTAINLSGTVSPYRTTHKNHPMSVWVRSSIHNYNYTIEYARRLCEEFRFRRGKTHKSESVLEFCNKYKPYFNSVELTTPPLCMPDEFHSEDYIQSYRSYYNKDKRYDKNGKFMYVWTRRKPPEWAIDPVFKP